jgi:hypothetical protein
MNDDKLPNYYDVTIEATLCEATSEGVHRSPYQLHVEDVEAGDGRSAVEQTLRSQHARWQDFTVEPGEGGEGWVFCGDEDDPNTDDWLEFDLIDDYGDFATAVPYERRLRLAGYQPMGFVNNA